MSAGERFLVTGALGCIGAWTCAVLAEEGVDGRRLRLRHGRPAPAARDRRRDPARAGRHHRPARRSRELLDEHGITHVIHLAALLLPQIKPDPPYGTAVNIGGTVNVLDAAKTPRHPGRVRELGCGVLDRSTTPAAPVRTTRSATRRRSTACTSRRARGWRASSGTRSRCRRSASGPFIVYGPGRDYGLTASPSLAMAAAARGRGLPDRVRRAHAAAVRARHGARLHRRGPRRDRGCARLPSRRARPSSLDRGRRRDRGGRARRLDHRRRGDDPAVPGGVRRRAARRRDRRRSAGRRSQRASVRPSSGCEPRRAERRVDHEQARGSADEHPEHGVEAARRVADRAEQRAARSPTACSRPRASSR